jgi:hypothetical protein
MRKLLLVLFLCSLTTNALAKEFIMKCVDVNDINDIKVFKINTEIPIIQRREGGKWINPPEEFSFKYSKVDNSIFIYDSYGGTKVLTGAIDLFTRELIHIPSYDEVGDPPKVLRTCQSFKE